MCTFFNIILYNTSLNIFTGEDTQTTLPMVSVAARNNRIMNVTQAEWAAAQNKLTGACLIYEEQCPFL